MQCPMCKEEIQDGAIKCKHCGSMISQSTPQQAPDTPVNPINPVNPASQSKIDQMQVSHKWKELFKLFASGNIGKVGSKDKLKFSSDHPNISLRGKTVHDKQFINWWAAIFSCFWYMAKGMWKKGIFLFVIATVANIIAAQIKGSMAVSGTIGIAVASAMYGSYDYYRAKVLNESFWW